MTPVVPRAAAAGAGTPLSATGGSADVEAESADLDGAAEAGLADAEPGLADAEAGLADAEPGLADAEADFWGAGDTAVAGGAVVDRGVLRGGAELPTVRLEFPLL